jgi:hypothetical protein
MSESGFFAVDNRLLRPALEAELLAFRQARGRGDRVAAWTALERAHIYSQPDAWQHTRVHGIMLAYGLRLGDGREVWGQILRLAVAAIGTLLSRAPVGNTGRAEVPILQPMPVPPDIAATLEAARRH